MPENRLEIRHDKLKTLQRGDPEIDDVALPKELRWFAVYLEDRAYGGPEEGGWWYDYANVEERFPITCEADAEALFKIAVKSGFDNEGRRDINSVLSEGLYRFVASWSIPADWPARTPHYE